MNDLPGMIAAELRGAVASRPLRFMVIHDAGGMRRWQWNCVEALRLTGDATLVALIDGSRPGTRPNFWQRMYDRLVAAGVRGLERMTCPPNTPTLDYAPPAGAVDFILDLTASGADQLDFPRLGIWQLRLGDALGGELPGSWEMAQRLPTITITLAATHGARERVLHYATIKTRRSHRATVAAALEAAASTCVVGFRRLCAGQAPLPAPTASVARYRVAPAQLIGGQMARLVRRTTDVVFFRDIWSIGIMRAQVADVLAADILPMPAWKLMPDDGQFQADPFLVKADGRDYVLFELYDPNQRRGLIAAAPMDDLRIGSDRVAIDQGCHMSYPMVFLYGGETYCAPETHVLGGLRVFRMGPDPWHWVQVAHVLPHVPLLDATMFQHGELWWLLATQAGDASDTDLYGWYAISPFGPWTPHSLNPLKSDVASARPAGNVFRLNGRLYRPAQDCTNGYGSGVVINEIVQLDKDHFWEVEIRRLKPGQDWPFRDGLHTFNVYENSVVIDAKRRCRRFQGG